MHIFNNLLPLRSQSKKQHTYTYLFYLFMQKNPAKKNSVIFYFSLYLLYYSVNTKCLHIKKCISQTTAKIIQNYKQLQHKKKNKSQMIIAQYQRFGPDISALLNSRNQLNQSSLSDLLSLSNLLIHMQYVVGFLVLSLFTFESANGCD